jgi:hypothetical protein
MKRNSSVFSLLRPLVCLLATSIFIGLTGCATSSEMVLGNPGDDLDSGANVHPAAHGVDHFTFRKLRPKRNQNNQQFYFRHCDLIDARGFYSKTSYGCTPL